METRYWHCDCGINEPAQAEYELGDSEPCVHCEDGVARVVTLREGAAWEHAKAMGWRVSFSVNGRLEVDGRRIEEGSE